MKLNQVVRLNPVIRGQFDLQQVNFFYPNGHHALKDIQMQIQPNKITALVGLSGAGKSTLISLLDKFYEPQQGTIQLDGIDINHIDTQYLRDHIGLVLQKNHIFQGSIFENIRYGKTDASLEDVILAAQKASHSLNKFCNCLRLMTQMPSCFQAVSNNGLPLHVCS